MAGDIQRVDERAGRGVHLVHLAAVSRREREAIMHSYDVDLNHMSIRRFFRIVRRIPGLEATFVELKPAKYGFLKRLTRVPLLRELVTGTVVCSPPRS